MAPTKLTFAFFIAFALALLTPLFLPKFPLVYFAPFLVITFYRRSLINCLWWAFACGLVIDLFSSYHHLGLTALCYMLTTWILRMQKRHFFEDSISTIPLMTALFSFLSTLIHVIILDMFEHPLPIDSEWVKTNLLIMPILDAAYGFIVFALPGFFLPRRKNREYFL